MGVRDPRAEQAVQDLARLLLDRSRFLCCAYPPANIRDRFLFNLKYFNIGDQIVIPIAVIILYYYISID